MDDKQFYQRVLGLEAPWTVADVQLSMPRQRVEIFIEVSEGSEFNCPKCGKVAPRYDRRARRWRHLDTCQFETVLVAKVPRVKCPEHGVIQVTVPWADEGSKYTALFEQLVIHWLQEASVLAVAGLMRLSWCAVDGIRSRAVQRGRARRQREKRAAPQKIAVDETSYRKRHDYVTVVSDLEEGTVEWVAPERTKASLADYYRGLSEEERRQLSIVSMDMAQSYISATMEHVPHAEMKICIDPFHVAQGFSKAVSKVRSMEDRALRGEGCDALKGTRYAWLSNDGPAAIRMSEGDFLRLRRTAQKTSRAWAMKETARAIWNCRRRWKAEAMWKKLIAWMSRSRLEPMQKLATTIQAHLRGILNSAVYGVSNACAESINAQIQKVKKRACGFRNRDRFIDAIFFHLGGLDLRPERLAHTD